jgi:CubicO group peptidase (beta-lactamase class C family)
MTTVIARLFPRALVLVMVGVTSTVAQDRVPAAVDEFVKTEMQQQRIPGVSLAVVKDGRVALAKGYGVATVEHQVAVKPETIFQSGSTGKQFTAMAVMMLVEDGKIGLDDRVAKYLPSVPETWKNITVRHLLTHTSGAGSYPRDFDYRRDYTEDELLQRATAVPLDFQPGEKWSYSNLGFITLGVMVSKVTGKFYGEFLHERVFRPLEMTTARIISENDIVANRASGYRLVNGELKNQVWNSPTMLTTADGSLYLTVLDMAKWHAALYTEKLLKKSSLDAMWTPVTLNDGRTHNYGFGWTLNNVNGHRLIEHGGSWQGFKAYIARYVDDRTTVIVFANLAQANPGKIAHGVAALYINGLASGVPLW